MDHYCSAAPRPTSVQLHQAQRIHTYMGEYKLTSTIQAEHLLSQGLLALSQQQNEQAKALLQQCVQSLPHHVPALNALGVALKRLGQWQQAEQALQKALQVSPQAVDVLNNLANLYWELGLAEQCLQCCDQALQIDPQALGARMHKGLALNELGYGTQALAALQQAHQSAPDMPIVGWNLALLLLQEGQWQAAWPLYELRFKLPNSSARKSSRALAPKRWKGQTLAAHETLLIYAEQGLGDTLQFCRYAKVLADRGMRIVLEVQTSLTSLLKNLHPRITVIELGQYKGDYAYHAPLLSLPGHLNVTPTALGPTQAYLYPAPERIDQWKTSLAQAFSAPNQSKHSSPLRIGIVWRGLTRRPLEARRSLALKALLTCMPPNAQSVVLQKELSEDDEQVLSQHPGVWIASRQFKDFHDTAALCMQLDLIVSIDSSVAHLAGALGKPFYVLLPKLADWRWQLAPDHSPWYTHTRLMRQTVRGDWQAVLANLQQHLLDFRTDSQALHEQRASLHLRPPLKPSLKPPLSPSNSAAPSFNEVFREAFNQALSAYQSSHFETALALCESLLTEPRLSSSLRAQALHMAGVCLHRLGSSEPALSRLQAAIQLSPQDAATHNSLGIVQRHLGLHTAAIASYEAAIQCGDRSALVYNNLGNVLRDIERYSEALQAFETALSKDPSHLDSKTSLAQCLCDLQRADEALERVQDVLAQHPKHATAHNVLGNAYMLNKQYEQAQQAYQRATQLKADYHEAYSNWGNALVMQNANSAALTLYDKALSLAPTHALAWYNKGNAFKNLRQFAAAIECYGQAIAHKPSEFIYNNRGNVYLALRQEDAAQRDFEQALRLKPKSIDALCNLATVYKNRHDFARAFEYLAQAHALDPDNPSAYINRGNVHLDSGQIEQALSDYRHCLSLDANNAAAHMNLGMTELLLGQFETAWTHYEWRWQTDLLKLDKSTPAFPGERWQGQQDIKGRSLLIYWEQGLGDTIQFVNYAMQLQAMGIEVTLEIQEPLARLLQNLATPVRVITRISQRPKADFHCPMLSLPLSCQQAGYAIAHRTPYLSSTPALQSHWQTRLDQALNAEAMSSAFSPGASENPASSEALTKPLRIGLVWSGNPEHSNDRNRSIALRELLSALPPNSDVGYVCLQKDLRESDQTLLQSAKSSATSNAPDQALSEAALPALQFFGPDLKDFADTAALCKHMDLVISVDTSVAHLSAALGRPTWILLPYMPDWRWQLHSERCLWYPNVRLYRQDETRQWAPVLKRLEADLRAGYKL